MVVDGAPAVCRSGERVAGRHHERGALTRTDAAGGAKVAQGEVGGDAANGQERACFRRAGRDVMARVTTVDSEDVGDRRAAEGRNSECKDTLAQ